MRCSFVLRDSGNNLFLLYFVACMPTNSNWGFQMRFWGHDNVGNIKSWQAIFQLCFIVWEKFQIICRSALFAQKWFIFKKLDPGWHQICFCLICFFFFYDKTDTISRKKEGTRMKKNERGKTFSHVKNEAADWRNGFVSSTFFCLWRETNDLKVTSLLSHVWKWRNFCTTLAALCGAVNVYYFALNRSRYCVAVHSSVKKGKKRVKVNFEFFWKRNVFSWEKYLKAFKP